MEPQLYTVYINQAPLKSFGCLMSVTQRLILIFSSLSQRDSKYLYFLQEVFLTSNSFKRNKLKRLDFIQKYPIKRYFFSTALLL